MTKIKEGPLKQIWFKSVSSFHGKMPSRHQAFLSCAWLSFRQACKQLQTGSQIPLSLLWDMTFL